MTPDNIAESIAELKANNMVILLNAKKAGEGIPHNTLKQTLYRHINNIKQGKYFRDEAGTAMKLHSAQGVAFIECSKKATP